MVTEQADLVSRQCRYTPEKSCPGVWQKRATASALSRCLWIGPTVARVSHGFPRLLVFWVMIVYLSMNMEMILFALLRVKRTSGWDHSAYCLDFWSALTVIAVTYLAPSREPV
ncbi:hypothetical protein TNCV_4956721 [Trichonephila clavipes]|nr:hypothetical protein TNCV_4956721 [Trichonephila clavipes]